MKRTAGRRSALLFGMLLLLSAAGTPVRAEDDPIGSASVGDVITFGDYHGAIEWQVLSVQPDRIFVISRQGIDCRQYNNTSAAVTWETCSLRTWLNGDFIAAAFNAAEQGRILTTEVINSRPGRYGPDGNDTMDRVYILNMQESAAYFPTEEARKTTATSYAVDRGAATDAAGTCFWWLRSRGEIRNKAAYVYSNGKRAYLYVSNYHCCVRPVMWLSTDPQAEVSAVTTDGGDSVLAGSSGGTSGWILDPDRIRELLDRLLHAAAD